MIQHAQQSRPRRLPVATYALIVAQFVVWLIVRRYLLAGNQWTDFALIPGAPSEFGFLISPFIHLEATHLGLNLVVLWLFGTALERAIGSLRFLLLYLGAAWFASLMHWAATTAFHVSTDPSTQTAALGASGALAGVLGASMVRFPQPRLHIPFLRRFTIPGLPVLVLWLSYTLIRAVVTTATGISEGIGHWAHFAGFVFGLTAAHLTGLPTIAREEYLENRAHEAAARENLPAAASALAALLSMRPEDMSVRSVLINTRLALGDLPGARRLAREGVVSLVKAEDRERSIHCFRQYMALIPTLDLPPGIRFRIGCWLADAGQHELAFGTLLDSVREEGVSSAAAAALHRAGQVAWERLRNPARAREVWERLLEQFPDSPWCDSARDNLRRLTPAP